GVRLAQEADDLFFGKSLLHVQSPSVGGLDSKLRCYSKPGGRRTFGREPGPAIYYACHALAGDRSLDLDDHRLVNGVIDDRQALDPEASSSDLKGIATATVISIAKYNAPL
ncbi:MAG: hypothetical protein ACYC0F_18760, partial [Rhodanobacter sp.]